MEGEVTGEVTVGQLCLLGEYLELWIQDHFLGDPSDQQCPILCWSCQNRTSGSWPTEERELAGGVKLSYGLYPDWKSDSRSFVLKASVSTASWMEMYTLRPQPAAAGLECACGPCPHKCSQDTVSRTQIESHRLQRSLLIFQLSGDQLIPTYQGLSQS